MRSSSLARVVIASLGVSVVVTLGCGPSPPSFSVLSISPTEGSTLGATVATIAGTGFRSGDLVHVGGSGVPSTVLNTNTISLARPAHAAGKVEILIVNRIGTHRQAHASVPGGYTYVAFPLPPPVISELRPNIGSTGGGTPMIIIGTGFQYGLTVRVGGIVTPFEPDDFDINPLYLSTPAHEAGTVDVVVTNPDGRAGSAMFTYASAATFDFNGDWQGWAQDVAGSVFAPLVLTIRDNLVVSVSCGGSSLTLDAPAVVANGEFSFAGSGGVSITGRIVSANAATGTINTASCVNRIWFANKK